MTDDLKIPAFLDRRTTSPAWQGKCEAQRQVSDFQLGIPVTGTSKKNPYPQATSEWFDYEAAFNDFINMAFERE